MGLFGYARLGSKIRGRLTKVIDWSLVQGRFVEEGDLIRLVQ